MFNKSITKDPFDGTLSIKRRYKCIHDADGNIIGGITSKGLCDLNGVQIGTFERYEKALNEDGKSQNKKYYRSSFGEICSVGGMVFLDGKPLGTVEERQRNPYHIIMLAIASILLAVTIIFIALIDIPFSDIPSFEVVDKNGDWISQGTIAVLDDTIHPGSEGSYKFIIENPYNVELIYSIVIDQLYNNKQVDHFPLQFRLRMNNGLLLTEDWLSADELQYEELTFMPFSTQSFILEWRWLFESGDDELDTLLGIENGEYRLVFEMTAESQEVQ